MIGAILAAYSGTLKVILGLKDLLMRREAEKTAVTKVENKELVAENESLRKALRTPRLSAIERLRRGDF